MTTETIYGSRAFISRDRNPDVEPATWPFRRAIAAGARSDETTQLAQSEGRQSGPRRGVTPKTSPIQAERMKR